MITRTDTAGSYRLWTLVVLYGAQFLAAGVIVALPALLRERGASLEQIGAVSVMTFGTIAKVFWAPLVDRYGRRRRGQYRSWLLVVQPSVALVLVAMAPLDIIADFPLLLIGVAVLALLTSTQDVATDALAMHLTHTGGRDTANAIQVGAGFAGAIVGTTGTLTIAQYWGWSWAVTIVAVVSLVPCLVVYRIREPAPGRRPRTSAARLGPKVLVTLLRQPGIAWWIGLFVPLAWGAIILGQSLCAPLMVDGGWPLDRIGLLAMLLSGSGIVGALLARALTRALGRQHTLRAAVFLQTIATAGMLTMIDGAAAVPSVLVVGGLGLARGVTNTIVFTISMDLSRPESAGSDFSMLAACGSIVAVAAGAAGPVLTDSLGYAATIAVAVVISIASLACLWLPPWHVIAAHNPSHERSVKERIGTAQTGQGHCPRSPRTDAGVHREP